MGEPAAEPAEAAAVVVVPVAEPVGVALQAPVVGGWECRHQPGLPRSADRKHPDLGLLHMRCISAPLGDATSTTLEVPFAIEVPTLTVTSGWTISSSRPKYGLGKASTPTDPRELGCGQSS